VLVQIAVQCQPHAQLLEVSEEIDVLHLVVGRGHGVVPRGDAQRLSVLRCCAGRLAIHYHREAA
jgi:hypothetical protein